MSHPGTRSEGLDIARGFCLVIMTIDHLPHSPFSRFSNIHFGPFGFFTAASAFVFISGFVAARAYGRTYLECGPRDTCRRALLRMAHLYLVNTGLLLALLGCLALGLASGPFWSRSFAAFYADPWTTLVRGLVLSYTPGATSILPMYLLFLLLVTPALAAIHSARWAWVAGTSVLIWAIAQTAPTTTAFNAFGYQLLFVAGLLLGSTTKLEAFMRSPAAHRLAKICLVLMLAMMALRLWFAAMWWQDAPIPGWRSLAHLHNNGPLRVLNFALFAFVVAYWWPAISASMRDGWFLKWAACLGRYSLSVFSWSVIGTYLSVALMPEQPDVVWKMADVVLATSSLSLPAALHAMLQARQERRMRPA
jgi:hypothetical protein